LGRFAPAEWKRAQRNRAAALETWEESDFLRDAMAHQLLDRLEDAREGFPVIAEIGSGCGALLSAWNGQGGVKTWIQIDMAENALARSAEREAAAAAAVRGATARSVQPSPTGGASGDDGEEDDDAEMQALMDAGRIESSHVSSAAAKQAAKDGLQIHRVCGDPELLPLLPASVDAIVSVLDLHWTNDVQGVLRQARTALKPDGLFLAVLLGGESVHELTTSLVAAETERLGGVSDRASSMMRVADAGALLSAAGFALPAVDTGFVQVQVSSAAAAMELLGEMGESASPSRGDGPSLGGGTSGRCVLLATAAAMQWRHGGSSMSEAEAVHGAMDPRVRQPESMSVASSLSDEDVARRVASPVPMTFQTVWMAGFAPAPTQQKPLQRGSVPHGFRTEQPDADVPRVTVSATSDAAPPAAKRAPEPQAPQYPSMGGTVIDMDAEEAPSEGHSDSERR
jgi:NADH dehydrogenase [ubiquinone] 1 alpha subcomplex assembly factor 5